MLGMSLSAVLDMPAAKDFLGGLQSLMQEFESVQDDKFDRRASVSTCTSQESRTSGRWPAGFATHAPHAPQALILLVARRID